MIFKQSTETKNKIPHDLSKISYKCRLCGGLKKPPSNYEISGYIKYCSCNKTKGYSFSVKVS